MCLVQCAEADAAVDSTDSDGDHIGEDGSVNGGGVRQSRSNSAGRKVKTREGKEIWWERKHLHLGA